MEGRAGDYGLELSIVRGIGIVCVGQWFLEGQLGRWAAKPQPYYSREAVWLAGRSFE